MQQLRIIIRLNEGPNHQMKSPLSHISSVLVLLAATLCVIADEFNYQPPPTEFEEYVKHPDSRVSFEKVITTIESDEKWMKVIALTVNNSTVDPKEQRGVSFLLHFKESEDQVYLSVERTKDLLDALVELQEIHLIAGWRNRAPLSFTGNCMPSEGLSRIHDLCVNYYQGKGRYGFRVHSFPGAWIDLPNREPAVLADAVQKGLMIIEQESGGR